MIYSTIHHNIIAEGGWIVTVLMYVKRKPESRVKWATYGTG